MMVIIDSLMLRCWLESNFLCAGAWAREALIFGWLPVNSQRFGFKVHTDSGWRVRVSSKKLSGKKVGGCWSLIAGFGWRLWQFAKIWSQKILTVGILVLKMIGIQILSRTAGLLDDVWTQVQQFKKLKRGHWIFCWGFLGKIGVCY